MMKRLGLILALILAVAGAGCTVRRAPADTPVSAPTAVAEPAPGTPAPPPPRVDYWEKELCGRERSAAERQGLLVAILQADLKEKPSVQSGFSSSVLPKCILSSVLQGQEVVLLYSSQVLAGELFAAVAWKVADRWQVAPVTPPAQGWGDTGKLTLQRATVAGSQVTLLLTGASTVSSAWVRETILQGTLSQEGALQIGVVSDGHTNAVFDFLGPELVLVTFQGAPPGELGWTCTNCIPANRQELLRWVDNRFVKAAERVFRDPYATVNLFLGAVEANQLADADQFTTGPAVTAEILRTLGTANWTPSLSSTFRTTWEAERWCWEEIPQSHRKSYPAGLNTYSFELAREGQRIWLDLVRQDRGWVITRVRS